MNFRIYFYDFFYSTIYVYYANHYPCAKSAKNVSETLFDFVK